MGGMDAAAAQRSEVEKAEDALSAAWLRDARQKPPVEGVAASRTYTAFHAGCFRILAFADHFIPAYSVDDLTVLGRNEKWGYRSGRDGWDEPPHKLCDFTIARDDGGRVRWAFWVMVSSTAKANGALP